MSVYAYLRVSLSSRQDTDNQKLEILNYAQQNRLHVDEFIEIEVSSRKSKRERRIEELLEKLSENDTLIVSELSRLGRSLSEMINIVDELKNKNVTLIAIKQGINTASNSSMAAKCLIYLAGMFSEIERDFISQRTVNGIARARAEGRQIGRPKGKLGHSKLDEKVDEIKHLLGLGVSKASIAKICGVTRQNLYAFLKSRKLEEAIQT